MESPAECGRDLQQRAGSPNWNSLESGLEAFDVADGWTMIGLGGDHDVRMRSRSTSLNQYWSTSSMARYKDTGASLQDSEHWLQAPRESGHHSSRPNMASHCDLAPFCKHLVQLRDKRLREQTKVQNLRHKLDACIDFLDGDIGELSGTLTNTLRDHSDAVDFHLLASRFKEDRSRYQRQLKAIKAADAELSETEHQITRSESDLFEQMHLTFEGSSGTSPFEKMTQNLDLDDFEHITRMTLFSQEG